jgi:sigma-B regulation protein RsbU (phosphoserine phosphatase)
MASLTVLKGFNQGTKFPLKSEKILLGRNQDCDIVINVPAVSREHAIIRRVGGKFFIEDLKSRNLTYVNGEPINERHQLKDDDKIKICDNLFIFEETARLPLPPDMLPEGVVLEEEEESSSTVEARLPQLDQSSRLILETQPAEKLKLLLDITSDLTQSFDQEQLFPKIVANLFQVFKQADRSFVIFAEDGGLKLIPKVVQTRRRHDETTARFSRKIVRSCLETREALLSEDASSDKRFDLSQSIADCRIRSVMCVPLLGRTTNEAFGVIQLDTQDRAKKFTEEDLRLLFAVAQQAAIALENAELHQSVLAQVQMEKELRLAHEVQKNFLPKRYPLIPSYTFHAFYEPAREVGGDFYDFIPLAENRLALTIGDVAGKGVPAALLMAKVSSDTRFLLLTQPTPAEAITKLNDFMQEMGLVDRFITLECAVINLNTHHITIVNAGHMSPVLYRKATGEVCEALSRDDGGLPLGVMDQYTYESYDVAMEPGDVMVLFSDGVTEAPNQKWEEFQMHRVFAALRSGPATPSEMVDRLVTAVQQHSRSMKQHDDITVVAFGRTA